MFRAAQMRTIFDVLHRKIYIVHSYLDFCDTLYDFLKTDFLKR